MKFSVNETSWDNAKHPRGKGGKFAPTGTSKHFDQDHPVASHLASYKNDGYRRINGFLRDPNTGANDASAKESIKQIDKAFTQSKLSQSETLYRGIADQNIAQNAESMIGQTISSKGFQSSTRSKNVAEYFSIKDGRPGATILKISASKGTRAIAMDHFSTRDTAHEQEILLNRGQRFKIESVDRSSKIPVISVRTVK